MGKITTREEINLRYLEGKIKLKWDILECKIEQSDETRQAVLDLGDPTLVYNYVFSIDRSPRDDTRQAACKDPEYAYWYASDVDKSPRDDTRQVACKDPECAYYYALDIDKSPRDDTRQVACKDPKCAYYYALDIDKSPRDDTRKAASKNLYWKEKYKEWEKSLQEKR